MKTYHKLNLMIDICLSHTDIKWNFIVSHTAAAIINAEFLSYYKLAVDVGAKRLIETEKSNVLELVKAKSEELHETPCKLLIAILLFLLYCFDR